MTAVGFSDIDLILAVEPDGYVAASQLAYQLGKGVLPIRPRGKLHDAVALGHLEVDRAGVTPGQTVLLVGGCTSPALAVAAQELRARGVDVRTLCV